MNMEAQKLFEEIRQGVHKSKYGYKSSIMQKRFIIIMPMYQGKESVY